MNVVTGKEKQAIDFFMQSCFLLCVRVFVQIALPSGDIVILIRVSSSITTTIRLPWKRDECLLIMENDVMLMEN